MTALEHISCEICGSGRFEEVTSAVDARRCTDTLFRVVKCAECGFHYLNPRPPAEEMEQYYPRNYYLNRGQERKVETANRNPLLRAFYQSFHRWDHRRKRRDYERRVGLVERYRQEGEILDVGCGEGTFLANLSPLKWKRHGIDFSAYAIEEAKKERIENLCIGGVLDLPFGDRSFDVITLWHVLEHIRDPKAVMKRVHALLKDSGVVILTVPNLEGLEMKVFRRLQDSCWEVPRHLYHFTLKTLSRLLEETDFSILEINQKVMARSGSLLEGAVKKHLLSFLKVLGVRYRYADRSSPLSRKISFNIYAALLGVVTRFSYAVGSGLSLLFTYLGMGHTITVVCRKKSGPIPSRFRNSHEP